MIFKFTKNSNLYIYYWHSINLIPCFASVSICDDNDFAKIIGRTYEMTLFGVHFSLMLPAKKFTRLFTSPVWGPLYSRRRKIWYWPDKV